MTILGADHLIFWALGTVGYPFKGKIWIRKSRKNILALKSKSKKFYPGKVKNSGSATEEKNKRRIQF